MKFSLSWLQDHLETDATIDELTKRMTDIGLEVEDVKDPSAALTSFIIVSIVEVKSHPNAEKLKICQVDTGTYTVKVICGAPNVEKGMKSVYAAPGCVIPTTGKKLKVTKIRGVESNGMLCSEHELGLSNNHDGIIKIPKEAPLGKEYASYIGLDDPIFDISITPNRADCLGISGIARDLSAAGLGTFTQPKFKPIKGMFKSPITVKREIAVEDERLCPLFLGQYIRGVTNNPSPKWMQDRLLSAGLRPISALVDITNFITMDQNRPAHVFDADKIQGDKLWIRSSNHGSTFSALNGQDYVLGDKMTVIGDKTGILSLAGIIGGETSSCTEETKNVFVEVALFDPVATASTGRKLNIETDARYRFERGIDPDFALCGIEHTTKLITEICGGEASDIVSTGNIPDNWKREIIFRPSRVESLGGLKVEPELCCSILKKLGFNSKTHENDTLLISPPSWRGDIVGEADLVEEILRIIGFDSIKPLSLQPIANVNKSILPLSSRRVSWMRRALTSRGMSEVITWSFMSGAEASHFGSINENLKLENPISSDLDIMRPSILPNLVNASKKNTARGYPNLALFEGGPQYLDNTFDGQMQIVAGIRVGKAIRRSHYNNERNVDCFDVKADALAALEAAQSPMNGLVCGVEAPDWYHPGRSGCISLGKNALGFFGQLHPAALKALAIDFPIMAFEIFVDKIPQHKKRRGHSRPAFLVSDLPVVDRDFAFVINESVTSKELIDAAYRADKELITNVDVFDIYQGKTLGDNKKSIAISIKLRPHEKTLTDSEIDIISQKVIANVEKMTGGSLRE